MGTPLRVENPGPAKQRTVRLGYSMVLEHVQGPESDPQHHTNRKVLMAGQVYKGHLFPPHMSLIKALVRDANFGPGCLTLSRLQCWEPGTRSKCSALNCTATPFNK